ncbi:CaiB/BaiF CoA transferase family protein [Natronocalculus amylovorans]|uniref:CoA transferase n=1 Tax=Natronocalculus amylovorans TaxID=2917812 RepID=A0AAE3FVX0_9EURY|nr:CaiB/BaiF CoA-transferase family protein [Natronocalculus amylovorans]MCL9816308.1 CoA transferase [Natronocalculus amylovorans]NUE03398.1 CoA transferase [Halorubraceae archaeon YAN]
MTGEAQHPEQSDGPLSGITVIDASRVLSGPFCTMQLGDLGADVIKIERPETGDQTRGWHPPTFEDSGESAYYVSINRNKRSIAVNLADQKGRELVRELVSDADVFVENFRTGKPEQWNLGYKTVRELNPSLVYCSISGYGEWGPKKDHPAYDLIMQAESGLMSITGEDERPPVRVGVAIADIGAGHYATQSIVAALLERELGNGRGQKLDIALLDVLVAWMTYMASNYAATGESPTRMGSKHPTIAPYQGVETADGHVIVAVPSANLWPKFCVAIDREDLIDDDRFETNEKRVRNREALDAIIADVFATQNTETVIEKLTQHGVPASNVNTMADVFAHEQLQARRMIQTVSHPCIDSLQMVGVPMQFSKTPASIRKHPPLLGEHTTEILTETGYTDEEITAYFENDIVG